jgi:hypothetical protein
MTSPKTPRRKAPPPPARPEPLSYATMAPEERARRQAIMDQILAKHERETGERTWLKEHRTKLIEEVKAWEDCETIRRYVAMVDARIQESGPTPGEYAKWRDDALRVADMLDPVKRRLST